MQLPTPYQTYMHVSKYARWLDDQKRREDWGETTHRYFRFMEDHLLQQHGVQLTRNEIDFGLNMVRELRAMPSMRALMTAGPALKRDHVCGYNCAYVQLDHPCVWPEILYILACATGVGYSVERQFISKLPEVPQHLVESDTVVVVRDSKVGWADALNQLLALLYSGHIPKRDTSRVRPAGSRLKTMGGRASGPEPLIELFNFIIETFKNAQGRKLNSLECHDITCKVGDAIIVGGVRRAALISLSNLSDQRMRDAKSGDWWQAYPWRALANNSVAYTERPEVGQWMAEWTALYSSKAGERGIFNREAAYRQAMENGRRRISMEQPIWTPDDGPLGGDMNDFDSLIPFGVNPCGEIILRSGQFCNLTSVVAREDDDVESLTRKVRAATMMGTWQSTLTGFRFLRKRWKDNCEEERLLGVSLSGIQDSPLLNGRADPRHVADLCEHLKEVAQETNLDWAARIGIRPAAAITCVKPEGNSSQLVGSASGIHYRFAKQYARRVRQDNMDPLTQFMKDMGIPHEPDVMKPDHQTVFTFAVQAPESAITDDEVSAVEKLEHWKLIRDHWCEHNPSTTVNVREQEWPRVGAWVWDNFDTVGGLTFLPTSGHTYRQAPYEALDDKEFAELESRMPEEVDWSQLSEYENRDTTTGSREFACVGNSCEI